MGVLYTDLTTGPLATELAPFLAAGDYHAAAEIMNRKDISVYGVLTAHDIRQYLALEDLLLPIEESTAMSCKVAARVLDIFPQLDLSKEVVLNKFTQVLDALVAETVIPDFTETHKATLLYLGHKLVSRAEQLGIYVDYIEINNYMVQGA